MKLNLAKLWDALHSSYWFVPTVMATFAIGKQRTEQQDIEFSIDQLVEIAMRAISPGINDPFTAIQCINQLSAGLSHLAERDFPSLYRFDDQKKLRVIAETLSQRETGLNSPWIIASLLIGTSVFVHGFTATPFAQMSGKKHDRAMQRIVEKISR